MAVEHPVLTSGVAADGAQPVGLSVVSGSGSDAPCGRRVTVQSPDWWRCTAHLHTCGEAVIVWVSESQDPNAGTGGRGLAKHEAAHARQSLADICPWLASTSSDDNLRTVGLAASLEGKSLTQ